MSLIKSAKPVLINVLERKRLFDRLEEALGDSPLTQSEGRAGSTRRHRSNRSSLNVSLSRRHYQALLRVAEAQDLTPEEVAEDLLAAHLKFL